MDFAFFEQLTERDARRFLESYRSIGADGINELEQLVCARGGDTLDFTAGSAQSAFAALAKDVPTIPAALDDSLPEWIRNSESYRAALHDFSDDAHMLILRLSYYLAETLLRTSGKALRWGVGEPDTAIQRQPVLDGFKNGVQMSPLLVTENLLRRLIEEPDPSAGEDVVCAISTWRGLAVVPWDVVDIR